jgi:hypothetical protein
MDKIQSFGTQPDSTFAHSARPAMDAGNADSGALNSGAIDVEMNDEGVAEGSMAVEARVHGQNHVPLGDEHIIGAQGTSDHEMDVDSDTLATTAIRDKGKSKDKQSNIMGRDKGGSESSESDSEKLPQRPTVGGKYKELDSSYSGSEYEDSRRTSEPHNKNQRGNTGGGGGRRGRGGRGRGGRGGKIPPPPASAWDSDRSNRLETVKTPDDDMRKPIPLRFMTPIDVDMLVSMCNSI